VARLAGHRIKLLGVRSSRVAGSSDRAARLQLYEGSVRNYFVNSHKLTHLHGRHDVLAIVIYVVPGSCAAGRDHLRMINKEIPVE